MLAVIDLSRCINAIGMMTEIDFVEIKFQDLFFGKLGLDLHGKHDLGDLAEESLFVAQKEVPCNLHGNGAASLSLLPGAHEFKHRPQQALIIHPRMLEKTVVFRREESLYR